MEEWKEISVDRRYEVSNMGRVRNKKSGHILATNPTKSHRHPQVFLMGNMMGRLQLTVSRLVYGAFVGKIKDTERIYHLDGNIFNNRVENLYKR